MKKIYALAIALIAFGANAQYDINFDDMSIGPVSPQSPFIEIWPAAGVTDCNVVIDESQSEPLSMYVGNNQTDDVIFLLGNQASGTWTVRFDMLVYSGATGFWNIQDNEIAGTQWNGQFFVGATASGGSAGVITHDDSGNTAPYTPDQWFEVKHEIDLDAMTHSVWIDGVALLDGEPYQGTGGVPANSLGSVNYYSIDTDNSYFIDNFRFVEGVLSTNEFENAAFTVFPNPVVDQLNIKSNEAVNNVSVYDVTGKLLQSVQNTKSIDMSSYNSGVYFVEVTIGNSTQTVKVLK